MPFLPQSTAPWELPKRICTFGTEIRKRNEENRHFKIFVGATLGASVPNFGAFSDSDALEMGNPVLAVGGKPNTNLIHHLGWIAYTRWMECLWTGHRRSV